MPYMLALEGLKGFELCRVSDLAVPSLNTWPCWPPQRRQFYLGARYEQPVVHFRVEVVGQRLPEAGPAGVAVVLGGRRQEERLAAGFRT